MSNHKENNKLESYQGLIVRHPKRKNLYILEDGRVYCSLEQSFIDVGIERLEELKSALRLKIIKISQKKYNKQKTIEKNREKCRERYRKSDKFKNIWTKDSNLPRAKDRKKIEKSQQRQELFMESVMKYGEYKEIPNNPGYFCFKSGQIYSYRNSKILQTFDHYLGYKFVSGRYNLGCGKKRMVLLHQLVAYTFLGQVPDGYEINHKDGNKDNNHIDNLEYVTHKENVKHAWDTGLIKNSMFLQKPIVQICKKTGNILNRYESAAEIERVLGIDQSCVSKCCYNKQKTSGGFRWEFEN